MAPQPNDRPNHIEVVVHTTSGSYPSEGFTSVPTHQKVRHILDVAIRELKLVDTGTWIASVNGRDLNSDANYLENHLTGQAEIQFGPREGGGGA
jgi:hypothetical protein